MKPAFSQLPMRHRVFLVSLLVVMTIVFEIYTLGLALPLFGERAAWLLIPLAAAFPIAMLGVAVFAIRHWARLNQMGHLT